MHFGRISFHGYMMSCWMVVCNIFIAVFYRVPDTWARTLGCQRSDSQTHNATPWKVILVSESLLQKAINLKGIGPIPILLQGYGFDPDLLSSIVRSNMKRSEDLQRS